MPPEGMFTVTIENLQEHYMFFEFGIFNTPVGAGMPGPLLPGHSYTATFHASTGHRLSFATMYVKSNDLFYAFPGEGLAILMIRMGGPVLVGAVIGFVMSLWLATRRKASPSASLG